MPAQFTLPPDTRSVGSGNPPADVNAHTDALIAMGTTFNVLNATYAGGADPGGVADSTAAIQAAITAAATTPGGVVIIPAGKYLVCTGGTPITLASGTVIRGTSAGTYPGGDAIPAISYLTRAASANCDVLLAPDGTNYCRIYDLAIDGNKTNNTSGFGLNVADGAAGQEAQFIIERCYFHDNPYSNIYLGNNRRANKVLNGVFNQSATGDGITSAGSDNTIQGNICGSNGRAGICLGTNITQNWAATTSFAGVVTHVSQNDCFLNVVGIAIASFSSMNTVFGNGIDRNTKQGITVYDGASNTIIGNSLHSNGTLTNNTYAHIDVAAGVAAVNISDNNFGPLDSGITNVATYGVNVAAGAAAGCVNGNIGVADSTATVSGLINLPAKRLNPPPAASVSYAPSNPATTVSATLVMMGLGSTCTFTPKGSGKVLVNVTGGFYTGTASANINLGGRYGTSTAPGNGTAVSGTRFGGAADGLLKQSSLSGAAAAPFAMTDLLTLTPGTAYWFDLALSSTSGSDAATLLNISMTFAEQPA